MRNAGYAFLRHLIDAVEGFDKLGWSIPSATKKGRNLAIAAGVVSKLRRKRPMCAEEFTYCGPDRFIRQDERWSARNRPRPTTTRKSQRRLSTVDAFLADLVDLLRR